MIRTLRDGTWLNRERLRAYGLGYGLVAVGVVVLVAWALRRRPGGQAKVAAIAAG